MPTNSLPRYMGDPKENRIKYPFKGQVRFLQVCLDYEGDEALHCTIDGENLKNIAIKNGVQDIVCLYDHGKTPLAPTKSNLQNEFKLMAQRCQPGDMMIFQFSGHGTHEEDQDGDESDGQDEAFCLVNEEGESELLIDDDMAKIVNEYLDPKIPCLFLVDACHSGTILDLTNEQVWKDGRRVCCISGCQDNQTSGDTEVGGVMTGALLSVLKANQTRQLRKTRSASIQFIFNRMIGKMPENEEGGEGEGEGEEGEEGEDDFDFNGDFDEDFEDMDFEEDYDEEQQEDEEEYIDPGQCINLSWVKGADPTHISFPF